MSVEDVIRKYPDLAVAKHVEKVREDLLKLDSPIGAVVSYDLKREIIQTRLTDLAEGAVHRKGQPGRRFYRNVAKAERLEHARLDLLNAVFSEEFYTEPVVGDIALVDDGRGMRVGIVGHIGTPLFMQNYTGSQYFVGMELLCMLEEAPELPLEHESPVAVYREGDIDSLGFIKKSEPFSKVCMRYDLSGELRILGERDREGPDRAVVLKAKRIDGEYC